MDDAGCPFGFVQPGTGIAPFLGVQEPPSVMPSWPKQKLIPQKLLARLMSSCWKPNSPPGGYGAAPVHQKLVPVGQKVGEFTWALFMGVLPMSICCAASALNSPVSSAKIWYWIESAAGPEIANSVKTARVQQGTGSARAGSKTIIERVNVKTARIPIDVRVFKFFFWPVSLPNLKNLSNYRIFLARFPSLLERLNSTHSDRPNMDVAILVALGYFPRKLPKLCFTHCFRLWPTKQNDSSR